jgi:hypothetical protein
MAKQSIVGFKYIGHGNCWVSLLLKPGMNIRNIRKLIASLLEIIKEKVARSSSWRVFEWDKDADISKFIWKDEAIQLNELTETKPEWDVAIDVQMTS